MKPIYKFTPKQIALLKEHGFEVSKITPSMARNHKYILEEIRVGEDGFYHISMTLHNNAVTYKTIRQHVGNSNQTKLPEVLHVLGKMRKQAIKDLEETIRSIRGAYYI